MDSVVVVTGVEVVVLEGAAVMEGTVVTGTAVDVVVDVVVVAGVVGVVVEGVAVVVVGVVVVGRGGGRVVWATGGTTMTGGDGGGGFRGGAFVSFGWGAPLSVEADMLGELGSTRTTDFGEDLDSLSRNPVAASTPTRRAMPRITRSRQQKNIRFQPEHTFLFSFVKYSFSPRRNFLCVLTGMKYSSNILVPLSALQLVKGLETGTA